jgi:hypothetical protein
VIGALVVVVTGLSLAAGPLLMRYANRQLASLPGYQGSVERIEVSLRQGRGEVIGIVFASVPEPGSAQARAGGTRGTCFRVDVQRLDFDLSWGRLLRGHLSIAIEVDGARVVVEGSSAEAKASPSSSTEVEENARESIRRWQDPLHEAFPFEISQLRVRDTQVTYRDVGNDPPVEIELSELEAEVVGLSNEWAEVPGDLPTRVGLQAVTTGEGRLRLLVQADPMAPQPRFEARLQIEEVHLPAWNAVLRDALKAEIAEGLFSCSAEATAAGGLYWGYVKPIIRELKFAESPEEPAGLWQTWRTRLMNWGVAFFGRGRDDKIASKIPFSGNFEETNVDVWTPVESLLRNAFIRGLREGLEGLRSRR